MAAQSSRVETAWIDWRNMLRFMPISADILLRKSELAKEGQKAENQDKYIQAV